MISYAGQRIFSWRRGEWAPPNTGAKPMTMSKPKAVVVTRCEHCGHEAYGFRRATGRCPRCDAPSGQRFDRRIANPHPDTVARAEREEAGR